MSYTVEQANALLTEHFSEHPGLTVDKYITSGKPFVFTSTDNEKIVKIVSMEQRYISAGLEKYIRLSNAEGHSFCNICKLLDYKEIPSLKIVIIIMENCGQDLFVVLNDARNRLFTFDLRRLLELSLELFKQIVCLQHPKDGSIGVVDGDIKLENVSVKIKDDGSLNVRIIDLDSLPQINPVTSTDGGLRYSVFVRTFTRFTTTTKITGGTQTDRIWSSEMIRKCYELNKIFLHPMLMLEKQPPKNFMDNTVKIYYNIPNMFGDRRTDPRSKDKPFVGTIEYLHIIDICSWCYVILCVLQTTKESNPNLPLDNLFCYNAILLIVMNIMIPNFDNPQAIPIDCFGKPINKEYCDKVVNGLTLLLQLFAESFIPNQRYRHSKLKLFFSLIQECSSSSELKERFDTILKENHAFYDENFSFTDVSKTYETFDIVEKHVTDVVSVAGSAFHDGAGDAVMTSQPVQQVNQDLGAGAGGAGGFFRKTKRRICHHHKKLRRSSMRKKSKKVLKFKRTKNKTKLRRVL
jgi:hypothetical protein